jgi:hypothetical protein
MRASLEKNPRLTPLSIGRSDASGDGGLKAEGRPYNEQVCSRNVVQMQG